MHFSVHMFYELRVFPGWTLESTSVVPLLLLVSHNEIKIAICYASIEGKLPLLTIHSSLSTVRHFLWWWLRTITFNIAVGYSKKPVRWGANNCKRQLSISGWLIVAWETDSAFHFMQTHAVELWAKESVAKRGRWQLLYNVLKSSDTIRMSKRYCMSHAGPKINLELRISWISFRMYIFSSIFFFIPTFSIFICLLSFFLSLLISISVLHFHLILFGIIVSPYNSLCPSNVCCSFSFSFCPDCYNLSSLSPILFVRHFLFCSFSVFHSLFFHIPLFFFALPLFLSVFSALFCSLTLHVFRFFFV
jgi:hypothetical protein